MQSKAGAKSSFVEKNNYVISKLVRILVIEQKFQQA